MFSIFGSAVIKNRLAEQEEKCVVIITEYVKCVIEGNVNYRLKNNKI